MSIENLAARIPDFADDLRRNLLSLAGTTVLTEQQLWGTFLACAAATRSEPVFDAVSDEARARLSDDACDAALAAASVMAMNNVVFRARGWLDEEYDGDRGYGKVRTGLRVNLTGRPGVHRIDYELFTLAVSAVNGCRHCTLAHEKTVRAGGLSREQVMEAVKVAGTLQGVAQAVWTGDRRW